MLAVLSAVVVVSACSSTKTPDDPTAGWSAERLYKEARTEMSDRNWTPARTHLEAVESRFPFGGYAQQALMDLAYVNWKDEQPEQALAAIDRFQQQYPNHAGTDYMLYLKGLITFTPPSAMFSSITQQDPSERDPKGLRESYQAFSELIERYPNSRYTEDAKKRAAWLVDTLAQHEVHVAQYYYERHAYLAAINRAQTVLTEFQGVPIAEKALYIMYLSYDKLDMPQLRDDTQRVLDTNFPDSKYYTDGLHDKSGSWWNPVYWF
ncbi:outer membrane protein assembly factor BamD [Pusillimonas sp. CC-YST705]|uniref:Outer membrane protein assembly factor BamD n=1 Tax=Mesopusillimonas faecipullorum TaxID=2755040 RepID=A0ABS8CEB6_9BURK|nr:outer membrane protein assembly factor BamD [Mesopusillimonas faecipullorum]MCB5363924.1 outer membrane protein assembly factor BamD [Mesopusillimonas faecipullorum]